MTSFLAFSRWLKDMNLFSCVQNNILLLENNIVIFAPRCNLDDFKQLFYDSAADATCTRICDQLFNVTIATLNKASLVSFQVREKKI